MDEGDFSAFPAKARRLEDRPTSTDDLDDLYGSSTQGQKTNVTSNAFTPVFSPYLQDGPPAGGIPGLSLLARPPQEFYDNAAKLNVSSGGDTERSGFHS